MFLVPQWHWIEAGDSFGPYPERIRDLRKAKANGVYAIRLKSSGEVVYIGESHSHCLYQTMTRHLQKQHRGGFERYFVIDRSLVEVDWTILETKEQAMWLETYLLSQYQPVGNGDRVGEFDWESEKSYFDWAEVALEDEIDDEVPF